MHAGFSFSYTSISVLLRQPLSIKKSYAGAIPVYCRQLDCLEFCVLYKIEVTKSDIAVFLFAETVSRKNIRSTKQNTSLKKCGCHSTSLLPGVGGGTLGHLLRSSTCPLGLWRELFCLWIQACNDFHRKSIIEILQTAKSETKVRLVENSC